METSKARTGLTTTSALARLASAAAELAMGILDKNWAADLVHANDWQAALVPAYLAWNGARLPSILTIHNLAYQGLFPRESLRRIGAPEDSFHIDGARILRQAVLPQGRAHLRLAFDHRQREPMQRRSPPRNSAAGSKACFAPAPNAAELTGILNGIDESWDPRLCAQLAQPFGAGDWEGKRPTPTMCASNSGLRVSRGPIFGLVARLVHQKGIDLVLSAADEIIAVRRADHRHRLG